MLRKVEVYSSSLLVNEMSFDDSDPVETDLIQVTNVDGLDPVTASIDVVSSGNVDGAISLDPSVPTRNIVLTLRTNPDWNVWSFERLRQFIYGYFIPKSTVKLVFDSDEIGTPVEIIGIVESCEANPFTKDPEFSVSIVCPDPYFTTVDSFVVNGSTIGVSDWGTGRSTILYKGNVPNGIKVDVPDGFASELYVQVGNVVDYSFHLVGGVDGYVELISVPLHKSIVKINENGSLENILAYLQLGSQWPLLSPGANYFAVLGTPGADWTLTYYEKYGGL